MSEQVKSLFKALAVLEVLGKHPDGCTLQEISRKTGINKSSVHRMLATFDESGYVSQVSANKEYRLTMKLLHIGQAAMNADVTGLVKPFLFSLMQKVNETINFLSFDSDNIIYKDKLEPPDAFFRTRAFVGQHAPMYCSAAGKSYLAFSSDHVRQAYWKRNASTMKQLTENTILDKRNFFTVLDEIQARGYAIDDEENEAGISCVAVPILDKSGFPIYAVSISSLSPKMRRKGYAAFAKEIKATTELLEKKLF